MECEGLSLGHVCRFQCNPGALLIDGKLEAKCKQSGRWSSPPPICARTPELVDLAVNQPTAQSSTKFEGVSGLAVQSANTSMNNVVACTHTYAEADPWWRVDLGEPKRINKIVIQNTPECSMSAIENVEVRAGNSLLSEGNANPLCAHSLRITTDPTTATCENTRAQFVNIRARSSSQALSLCRVRVIGYTEAKPEASVVGAVDLGKMRTATQSSPAESHSASLALQRQCTATDSQKDPWWTADLMDVRNVSHVIVTAPLQGAYLQSPFEVRVGPSSLDNGLANPVCSYQSSLHAGETRIIECSSNLAGRYVTLHAPGWDKTLSLCDVRILGPESHTVPKDLTDLAIAKQWTSSSVAPMSVPSNNSCHTSTASDSPWWQMNLQVPSAINHVMIQTGPISTSLLGVEISNATHHAGCELAKSVGANSVALFQCNGAIGQTVTVSAFGWNQVLSVCQVEIWGRVLNN